jgi:hypothetical protein
MILHIFGISIIFPDAANECQERFFRRNPGLRQALERFWKATGMTPPAYRALFRKSEEGH